MKRSLLLLPVLAVLLSGCIPGVTQKNDAVQDTQPEQQMETTDAAMEDEAMQAEETDLDDESAMMDTNQYTLAEIAEHATADDCWLVIEGKVYDVTTYIDGGKHPGGAALLQGCGKDSTELFNDRPNGSGAHSENARGYLENFYIGELTQ